MDTHQQYLPKQLQAIQGVKQHTGKSICCVYFLCLNGRVVYVGKTVCLHARLRDHYSNKHFDSVFYIEVDKEQLKEVETAFIEHFAPRLNKDYLGRMVRSKAIVSNHKNQILDKYLFKAKAEANSKAVEPVKESTPPPASIEDSQPIEPPKRNFELVNSTEAAQILGVSEWQLSQWRQIGGGPPYYKIGRLVRYNAISLRTWSPSTEA